MTATENQSNVKRMFTKTNTWLAIAAVILAGIVLFQFVYADDDVDGASGGFVETVGAQSAQQQARGDTDASASAENQQPQRQVIYGMFGEEIEVTESRGGSETKTAPPSAASASRQPANPVPNPNASLVDRIIENRAIYLGEDDWNFIGVITLRFILNVFFAYILICMIFTKEHRIKEHSFSYFVSNILIFMVTSLLASVRVRQGFAFGLFAILSILRFRTEQLQVREMTFLFAALILGVINSLATDGLTIFAILWANIILCMSVYICDGVFMGMTDQINLVYDNTKLLAKDKKKELYEDIKNRFGYDVVNVVVMKMNYLTDSAEVKLIYKRDKKVRELAKTAG